MPMRRGSRRIVGTRPDEEDGTVIMARNTDRRRIEIELEGRLAALQSVQTDFEQAQEESRTLKARVEELEAELERRGSQTGEPGAEPSHGDPQDSDARVQELAIRVAELEAKLTHAAGDGETDTAAVS